jgi:spore germination protein
VILMAYDQHPRFGPPGPIAAYPWVAGGLEEMLTMIPRAKVLLGLAFYHRDWGEAAATTGSYAQAFSMLRGSGGELHWDADARAPWFSIVRQGAVHTVWMEDSRSIAEKVELARQHGLAGVAAWRLGQEDPAVWPVIEEYAKGKR